LRAKVADFGLAKNYVNAGFSAMTLEGDIRGTLSYSAPEQIIDSRYAKPPCDIYSVGATLYEYISGELPHEFKTGRSQIVTILEAEPIPLRERCPFVPAELAAAIHRALAKDPADRFSSAEEMRLALLPYSKRSQSE
jgi:serine/threonine protein kinase